MESTGFLSVFGKHSVVDIDLVVLLVRPGVRFAGVNASFSVRQVFWSAKADSRCSGGEEAEGEGVHDFVEDVFS